MSNVTRCYPYIPVGAFLCGLLAIWVRVGANRYRSQTAYLQNEKGRVGEKGGRWKATHAASTDLAT